MSRLFAAEPYDLIVEARDRYAPIRTFCLFSGGNDSMVTAHRCRAYYDELVFIDTGTAVPGVREFVVEAAEWLEKPLLVYEAPRDAYRQVIRVMGFPGPMQHGRCYNRLKERQLEALLRDTKEGHPRTATVLAITGLRRQESARRKGRKPITKRGSLIFCNPLTDWTDEDVAAYRHDYGLPESEVAALLHRSGECNCGAYATPDERHDLQQLFPEWWKQTIAPLEREAQALGLRSAKWGHGREMLDAKVEDAGELCSDCQLRMEAA